MKRTLRHILCASTLAISLPILSGCANPHPLNKQDPYESMNREIFAFNMGADKLIVRPITSAYQFVTPKSVQVGVQNAFTNLDSPITVGNDLLQGKIKFALSDTARFIVNSIWGICGLFDVASKMGLPPHTEDFGMTLNYWGNSPGSNYFMLPLLGPATIASSFGKPWDYLMNPVNYYGTKTFKYSLKAMHLISTRAKYMDTNSAVDHAFDPYIFVRGFYLKHREQLIEQNNESYHTYRENWLDEQAFLNG